MTRLGQSLKQVFDGADYTSEVPLADNSPLAPREFYSDFGPILHGKTNKPVLELAPYQIETWELFLKQGRLLEVKAQKVGESTKWLLVDFQLCTLKPEHPLSSRGYDTLIIAQSREHAREHVRTLFNLISNSPKYSSWLIDRSQIPDEDDEDYRKVLRSEQSKQNVIYIHNPSNPLQPSRIIGVSIDRVGSLASWKRIHHIHASDISLAVGDISEAFSMATSRLANTDGSMVIECPPTPPAGTLYEMWQRYRAKDELKPGDFAVYELPATEAVKYGIISQTFLDSEKERMPTNEYERLYLARFSSHFGNVFTSAMIDKALELGKQFEEKYGLEPRYGCERSQGHDPGTFFGTVVAQAIDGIVQVIHASESDARDDDKELFESAARIQTWPISKTFIDAAGASFISNLKRRISENPRYDQIPKEHWRSMRIVPVPFSTEHRAMLQNMVMLCQRGKLAISPRYDKLVTAMRTAVHEDWSLSKDVSLNNHVLDAARLCLKRWSVSPK